MAPLSHTLRALRSGSVGREAARGVSPRCSLSAQVLFFFFFRRFIDDDLFEDDFGEIRVLFNKDDILFQGSLTQRMHVARKH